MEPGSSPVRMIPRPGDTPEDAARSGCVQPSCSYPGPTQNLARFLTASVVSGFVFVEAYEKAFTVSLYASSVIKPAFFGLLRQSFRDSH